MRDREFADSLLEEAGFEPSVPLSNQGTLRLHSELFDPMIAAHNGRLVKTTGEGCTLSWMRWSARVKCQLGLRIQCVGRGTPFVYGAALVNRVLHAALCRNYGKLAVRLSLSRNRSMLPVLSGDMIDVGGKSPAAARGNHGGRCRRLFSVDGSG